MKGLICAGGAGTRLVPLTDPLSKHLLPVYDKPMIVHVIETLVKGGITEIMLVMSHYHPGLYLEMLGTGKTLGCNLYYRYLSGGRGREDAEGPGRSLLHGREWVGNEDFAVILGDAFFIVPLQLTGKEAPHAFLMPLEGFDDPSKYSNVVVSGDRVADVRKKPQDKDRQTGLVEAGVRIFPPDAFDRIERLSQEKPGVQVEVSDLSMTYIREGAMRFTMLPPRSFIDCGTHESLFKAGMLAREMATGKQR